MKVVHVGFRHRSDDIRIFKKECCSLANNGHEVTYITSDRSSSQPDGIYGGVQVKTISLIKANRLKRFLRYCKDLKKALIEMDSDVYHFHECGLLPVMAYMYRHNKCVIYDMHEDSPRRMFPMLCRKFGTALGRVFTKLLDAYENKWISKADYVIAATPHIWERCQNMTTRTSVVANYPIVHTENDKNGENDFSKRRMQICYTGGISEINGIFKIMKAMENVQGELVLAGDLDSKLKERLEVYPAWEKVKYLGYLNREEVQGIFKESLAGLVLYMPAGNTVEALPNKMFEYMEAGLPVIASNFPLWQEIIEGNNCGICVDPSDSKEISDAINKILRDPKLAEEMGNNGRKAVLNNYNWGEAGSHSDKNIFEDNRKDIVLCYCGGMSEERNISMYVDVMNYVQGRLFLVGELDEGYKSQLMLNKAWGRVDYLGYLKQSELRKVYRKSDIGLCVLKNTPNHYYSLPIKMFEYMEAGIPIICSDFPLWKEIVEGNKCGICVPPENINELMDAIEFFVQNPEAANIMGKNGTKAVMEKYNWNLEKEELYNIYKVVCAH